MKRVSATLLICALAGAATAIGLARPATEITAATAAAPDGAETSENSDPYGSNDQADQSAGQEDQAAGQPDGGQSAAADQAEVLIEGFAFGGTSVVAPGQSISVRNLDSAPHTMTARDGSFDTGTIDGGDSTTLTLPTEPGTYEFFCAIHPSMVSTVTVQA